MATKTLQELQTAEEEAKAKLDEKARLYEDSKVGGIGLAIMGFGMGLKHQGGDFLRIVEGKQQAIRNKRMAMFEQAKQDRMDREAKMERDRDRALQMQRHNDSMNMQRMNASMSAMKNTVDLIADGNYRGAEMYSVAASKKLGSDYVRYHKKADGSEVMINFPANVDSKPIMGALQSGDPTYRLNDKNFVERYNPESQSYENTGWRGTLGTAYRLGGLEDDVGKGVVTVIGEDGKPKLVSRQEAVRTGAVPVKDASNLAKGQTFVSSLSPELQKFAKESYGVDDNGVVDTDKINKDFFEKKKETVQFEKMKKQGEVKLNFTKSQIYDMKEGLRKAYEETYPIEPISGIPGAVAALIPNSTRNQLENVRDKFVSNTTLETLAQMKAASPTGATGMGATNELEFKTVMTQFQNIDFSLSRDKVEEQLADAEAALEILIHGQPSEIYKEMPYDVARARLKFIDPTMSDSDAEQYLLEKGIQKKVYK